MELDLPVGVASNYLTYVSFELFFVEKVSSLSFHELIESKIQNNIEKGNGQPIKLPFSQY